MAAVIVRDGVVAAANADALALGSSCRVGVALADWFELGALDGRATVARVRDGGPWIELHRDAGEVVLLRDATDDEFAHSALDAVADSTFVLDGAGRHVWRSAQLKRRSQESDEAAAARNPSERIHPEDLPRVLDTFVEAQPGTPSRVVVRSRAVDDDDRWETIEVVVRHRFDHEVLAGYLVQVHNLDPGVHLDGGLDTAEEGWLSLTEAAPVGIVVADVAGEIVYRNRAARQLLGRDLDTLGNDSRWLELARAADRPSLRAAFDATLRLGETTSVVAGFDDGAGGLRWLRLVASPQVAGNDRNRGLIATLEDVTEQVEARSQLDAAEERLVHLATHDPLTDLPNRATIAQHLADAIARHDREQKGVAVLFCDLDGFKPINDRFGHEAGDRVLVEVAARMRAAVGPDAFVARIGGDEFVVVLEPVDAHDPVAVDHVADRIHAALEPRFAVADTEARLGTSIGIAVLGPGATATANGLLRIADQSMYLAKAEGPGRTAVRTLPT